MYVRKNPLMSLRRPGGAGAPLRALAPLDQWRADPVVAVIGLTVQAVDALAGVDRPLGLDGADRALELTDPALDPALPVPPQPLELAQARRQGEGSAAGQRSRQKARSTNSPIPRTRSAQATNHGSRQKCRTIAVLNGSTSARLVSEAETPPAKREQGEEDQELEAAQALVQPPGHVELRHPESPGALIEELLQGPERAQQPQNGPRPHHKTSAAATPHQG